MEQKEKEQEKLRQQQRSAELITQLKKPSNRFGRKGPVSYDCWILHHPI